MNRTAEHGSAGDRPSGPAPLAGRCLLLTGEEEASQRLAKLLEETGAATRSLPLTATYPPEDPRPLVEAAARLREFRWVVLTSARAARALGSALGETAAAELRGREEGQGPLWGCVGPATAAALRAQMGIGADLLPVRSDAGSLARAILAWDGESPGPREVFFPAAENARDDLVRLLSAAGWKVTRVTAYRTSTRPVRASALTPPDGHALWDGVVFLSGLAVQALLEIAGSSMGADQAVVWLQDNHPVVLGKSAEEALRRHGLAPYVRAGRPSLEELRNALVEAFSPARADDSMADLGR